MKYLLTCFALFIASASFAQISNVQTVKTTTIGSFEDALLTIDNNKVYTLSYEDKNGTSVSVSFTGEKSLLDFYHILVKQFGKDQSETVFFDLGNRKNISVSGLGKMKLPPPNDKEDMIFLSIDHVGRFLSLSDVNMLFNYPGSQIDPNAPTPKRSTPPTIVKVN
jgi:hypothetical protein